MSKTYVPLKSVLFMPGSNPRTLEKARELAADAVVFDLEDATAPDKKVEARGMVTDFFTDNKTLFEANAEPALSSAPSEGENPHGAQINSAYTKKYIIRVNGFATPWLAEDVKILKGLPIHAVIFPKVQSADEIAKALTLLAEAGVDEGVALWAMIETPMAVIEVDHIAAALHKSKRDGGLLLGGNDLSAELHVPHIPGRGNLLYAASKTVNAAKAYGLTVLDVVYNDLENEQGLAADAQLGVILGFDGKCLIHPKQIELTNQIWTPTAEQVADAKALIATFEEAQAEGKGVVTFKGKMIEELHVRTAKKVLTLAGA